MLVLVLEFTQLAGAEVDWKSMNDAACFDHERPDVYIRAVAVASVLVLVLVLEFTQLAAAEVDGRA